MEGSGFQCKFIKKGNSGGSNEGRQWAGPQLVTLAVPGPRMGEGG